MMDKPLVKWVTGLQLLAVYTYKPDCGSNIHHSDLLVLQLYKRLDDSLGYVPRSLLCTPPPNPEFGLQIHLCSLQHTQYGMNVFPVRIDVWIDFDQIYNDVLYQLSNSTLKKKTFKTSIQLYIISMMVTYRYHNRESRGPSQ